MNTKKIKFLNTAARFLMQIIIINFTLVAQNTENEVHIAGAMKNVMWKGELQGIIILDTISDKQHLYGLGPVEYLKGELLIIDGKSYLSEIENDSIIHITETFKVKAPFFAYANVDEWNELLLPESIINIKQCENYINEITKSSKRPFMFRIEGIIDSAVFHVVNLPEGTEVRSPDDAHKGEMSYTLINEAVRIIGFFSTGHKGIFTHHDTYLHMHLITNDLKKMGHVDKFALKKGSVKLYLPSD